MVHTYADYYFHGSIEGNTIQSVLLLKQAKIAAFVLYIVNVSVATRPPPIVSTRSPERNNIIPVCEMYVLMENNLIKRTI